MARTSTQVWRVEVADNGAGGAGSKDGSIMYGVIVQPITNSTTPANVESYGDVIDLDTAFAEGFSRDFCDGQTSPVPPRWADDQAGMIYTYDKRTADMFSGILRDDVAARIASGVISQAPSWYSAGVVATGVTAAIIAKAMDAIIDIAPAAVTSGQIETAINTAVGAGMRTVDDIVSFVIENAGWME